MVLADTPVAIESCESRLDALRPAKAQAFACVRSLDDLAAPIAKATLRSLGLVSCIGELVSQPREAVNDLGETQGRAVAVLHVDDVNRGANEVSPVKRWLDGLGPAAHKPISASEIKFGLFCAYQRRRKLPIVRQIALRA